MVKPAQKRSKPYAWVTWLAKLMAEEKQCQYAVWLLTQYQFDKLPSSFDTSKHDPGFSIIAGCNSVEYTLRSDNLIS
jgi:hypothetical protein